MGEMVSEHSDGAPGQHRLPYERPRLGRVKLAVDEVLVVGCKADALAVNRHGGTTCSQDGGCQNALSYGS